MKENTLSYTTRIGKTTFIVNVKQSESAKKPLNTVFQNKDLIADFKWWVEETGNLDDSPQTGDTSNILLWAVLAACSGSMMILLLVVRRRKEENANG